MDTINLANTGFVLLCTALVFFMTPGLAIFYAGFSREKNMLNILFQNFICLGIISILWAIVGFSLAFGSDKLGLIGSLNSFSFLNNVTSEPNSLFSSSVPFILIFGYQMMFAIITPALMTGSFVGRLRLGAYIKLIVLWSLFVYAPVAHWVWGGGFLQKWGVVDFAGGLVVHTTAGISALAICVYLGRRLKEDNTPVNLPLTAIGTGILWFGWFGFNAGGAYSPDKLAAQAFINTTLAASAAMLVWLGWQKFTTGKVNLSGLMVGSVAGLATITPAAGYVEATSALIIGAVGATLCFWAKNIQEYFKIDDSLEVWRAHGVGGITGSIMVGFFANGAVDGINASFSLFAKQTIAVAVIAIYSWFITKLILKIIDRNKDIRVGEQTENEGLDSFELSETAYHLNGKIK
ncbi:ammonium transporter [Photobacterium phosphoreum]|uniref:ammonium transporter n=1 Tax=Photobacterium phosphoreum TaxID=659 RepID=UPI0024BB6A2A|nr:ammonium transporter [Photobacterium phosphoreum]